MEEGYGGPVWHASAAPFATAPVRSHLRDCAREALEGVGDESLGEWEEWTGFAFHVRRRLTAVEQGSLEVVDVRGTAEAARRLAVVRRFLPADHLRMAVLEAAGA
jgi:hypothetical protein